MYILYTNMYFEYIKYKHNFNIHYIVKIRRYQIYRLCSLRQIYKAGVRRRRRRRNRRGRKRRGGEKEEEE